jgi:dTDP-4-amino-4,6-dideoxygalactose transaminase
MNAGARHAVALNSCTAALHLALAAIGVKKGDEVILPTMTFAATGEVVFYFRARPVLVDCAADSFHVDPLAVQKAITSNTKAILPVHFAGLPCEMSPILEISRALALRIIEDAAHALPASYRGKMVGALGDITCVSFYATKTLTTGDGGMATTDDPGLAQKIRLLSLHGLGRDAWKRYTAEGSWRYEILEPGFKYNLGDMQAAMGLAQLAKCEIMRRRRAHLAERYQRLIAPLDAYLMPSVPEYAEHAWHLFVLRVNDSVMPISRDRVIVELKQRGIETSVHFIPLHLHPLYQQLLGYEPGQFPNAEKSFESSISLPMYPDMTDLEQDQVAEALYDIAREHRR